MTRAMLAATLTLAGCGDGLSSPEAEIPVHIASPVIGETTRASGAEALELSAGMRTAMTKTLRAALAELDLQPDTSLRVLQAFFHQVEAQQGSKLPARGGMPRPVHR